MSQKKLCQRGHGEDLLASRFFLFTRFSSFFVIHFLSRLLIKSKIHPNCLFHTYGLHSVQYQSMFWQHFFSNLSSPRPFLVGLINSSAAFMSVRLHAHSFISSVKTLNDISWKHSIFREGKATSKTWLFMCSFSEGYFYSCNFLFTFDDFFNGSDFLFSRTFFSLSRIVVFNVSSMLFWDIILV